MTAIGAITHAVENGVLWLFCAWVFQFAAGWLPDFLNASGGSFSDVMRDAERRRQARAARAGLYVARVSSIGGRTGYAGRIALSARVVATAARRRQPLNVVLYSFGLLIDIVAGPLAGPLTRVLAGPPRTLLLIWAEFAYARWIARASLRACGALLFIGHGPFRPLRLSLYARWCAFQAYREAMTVWHARRMALEAERPSLRAVTEATRERARSLFTPPTTEGPAPAHTVDLRVLGAAPQPPANLC